MPTRGRSNRSGARAGVMACFLAATVAVWITGCVPADPGFADGGACAAPSVPAICPSPAPSFTMELMGQPSINDTIQTYCAVTGCHVPPVAQNMTPFQSYADIYSAAQSDLVGNITNCAMPPQGNPQPPAAELAALLAWVVCGAPDN
jgi:hypothetical protein